MKNTLLVIVVLLVAGCGEFKQTATEKPGVDLSIKEEVGGTYELKSSTRQSGKMVRFVFAENGSVGREEFSGGLCVHAADR